MIRAGVLLSCVSSFCDGLPYNTEKTHLIGKIEVVKLTTEQQIEVSRRRILTLTKPQWSHLKKLAKECPRTMQVLTNRYDDCTCGMGSVAVWFKPGEVEIPVNYLPNAPMTEEEKADFGDDTPTTPEILIDEHLMIWVKGSMVSESRLKKLLLAWKGESPKVHRRNEQGLLSVYIDAPPVMEEKQETKLSWLATRLHSFCKENEISLFISGFRNAGE
jgi:hypothetical protein